LVAAVGPAGIAVEALADRLAVRQLVLDLRHGPGHALSPCRAARLWLRAEALSGSSLTPQSKRFNRRLRPAGPPAASAVACNGHPLQRANRASLRLTCSRKRPRRSAVHWSIA